MTSSPAIEPFSVAIPQHDLDDLRDRLSRTRWPDELPGVGWNHGVPMSYLKELVTYWHDVYDWRAQEARLNEFPQFVTTIDGERLHFMHVRSPHEDALPLLITHGWPGSIVELLSIIDPLVDPEPHGGEGRDAFHVICPSLPGYGFSGPTRSTGWDRHRMAKALVELMGRLGYARYGVHGGDWGAVISREICVIDAANVIGAHVTSVPPSRLADVDIDGLTDDEKRSFDVFAYYEAELSGYHKLQSTRPQTLAYALADSPVGQLAWIVEKFKEWTDSEDVPEDAVDRDQMLTNVMLYWLTNTAGSSARLYYESAHAEATQGSQMVHVPTGVANFPHELKRSVRRISERYTNIVHWTEFDRGGHFAAMEEPDLLVADILEFFRPVR